MSNTLIKKNSPFNYDFMEEIEYEINRSIREYDSVSKDMTRRDRRLRNAKKNKYKRSVEDC